MNICNPYEFELYKNKLYHNEKFIKSDIPSQQKK